MQFLFFDSFKRSISRSTEKYMASVDLENASDRVPRKVLWWALRAVSVPEWLVKVVQAMHGRCQK